MRRCTHCHFLALTDVIREEYENRLGQNGMRALFATRVERIERSGTRLKVHLKYGKMRHKPPSAAVEVEAVYTLHRQPNIDGLNIDDGAVKIKDGSIVIDDGYNSSVSGVYAVGDCAEPGECPERVAVHGARAAESALEKPFSQSVNGARFMCHSSPKLIAIGMTEPSHEGTRRGLIRWDNGPDDGNNGNIAEIILDAQSEQVIGCALLGENAAQLANEAALAIRHELTGRALALPPVWPEPQRLAAAARAALQSELPS